MQEIGKRRQDESIKGSPQKWLRERLVKGKTNGTRNHHLVAKVLRFLPGGRQTFTAYIERAARNGDSEAREWWSVYSELLPAQQTRVDFDDVCEASGVAPNRILAVAVSEATLLNQYAAELMAGVAQPDIVDATIRSAKRIDGKHALVAQKDRELFLTHTKFLPQRGGSSVVVNANASAEARAQAAAASQPSVPTFSESLVAPIDAQIHVQKQLTGHEG